MRVVLDTNVVASALLWGGTPERLHALGNYQGISVLSPADCLKRVAT